MPSSFDTMPEAADSCSAVEVEWVSDGPFGFPFPCLQSYTCPRVYRATDAAGNVRLDTLVITVMDTIAPDIVYPERAKRARIYQTKTIVNCEPLPKVVRMYPNASPTQVLSSMSSFGVPFPPAHPNSCHYGWTPVPLHGPSSSRFPGLVPNASTRPRHQS